MLSTIVVFSMNFCCFVFNLLNLELWCFQHFNSLMMHHICTLSVNILHCFLFWWTTIIRKTWFQSWFLLFLLVGAYLILHLRHWERRCLILIRMNKVFLLILIIIFQLILDLVKLILLRSLWIFCIRKVSHISYLLSFCIIKFLLALVILIFIQHLISCYISKIQSPFSVFIDGFLNWFGIFLKRILVVWLNHHMLIVCCCI